jgi:ATP-dependent RNA helicase DDX54/DBP10
LHILNDVIKMSTGTTEAAKAPKEQKATSNPKKRKRGPAQPTEQVAENATIIFTATKHHVEYITSLLRASGFAVSYLYSSLDQTARKINIQSFRTGQTSILVVTDIAARGVDIPVLSNVLNYDFASSAKLWVHRVGRTARAGRKGWSYNLVTIKDLPYMLDLQLFLSKRLVLGRTSALATGVSFAEDMVVGTLAREKLESNIESVNKMLDDDGDLAALRTVAGKGEKLYNKTRSSASSESVKRAKEILTGAGVNELNLLFDAKDEDANNTYEDRENILKRIRGFRPEETVFEIGKRGSTGNNDETSVANMVRKARERMEPRRLKFAKAQEQKEKELGRVGENSSKRNAATTIALSTTTSLSAVRQQQEDFFPVADEGPADGDFSDRGRAINPRIDGPRVSEMDREMSDEHGAGSGAGTGTGDLVDDVDVDVNMASASEDELEVTFSTSTRSRNSARRIGDLGSQEEAWQDAEHFMSYTPRTMNLAEDRALSVHGGSGNNADFLVEARGATLDMGNDESKGFAEASRAKGGSGMRWDKKGRKYVSRANDLDGSREGQTKYIKGESGQKIAASFRSGRFEAWKKRERIERMPRVGEKEAHNANANIPGRKNWKHKQEKAPKEADKWRDDYHVRKKRVAEAREKRVGKFSQGSGKSELKGVEDIAKERRLKEKKREKTGRPSKSQRGRR